MNGGGEVERWGGEEGPEGDRHRDCGEGELLLPRERRLGEDDLGQRGAVVGPHEEEEHQRLTLHEAAALLWRGSRTPTVEPAKELPNDSRKPKSPNIC